MPSPAPPTQLAVRKALRSGERLLWSGRPRQGVVLQRADLWLVPASLIWVGLASVWELAALGLLFRDLPAVWGSAGPPPGAALWGALFMLAALYVAGGRFLLDARRRAQTYYGVTDRRVLILTGRTGRRVRSFPLRTLPSVRLEETAGGRGTIVLGGLRSFGALHVSPLWPALHTTLPARLEHVDDAYRVHGLLERTSSSRAA